MQHVELSKSMMIFVLFQSVWSAQRILRRARTGKPGVIHRMLEEDLCLILGSGHLYRPACVCVDWEGNVVTVTSKEKRLLTIHEDGMILRDVPVPDVKSAWGVAMRKGGGVVVVDALRHAVLVYGKSGKLEQVIGRKGEGGGELNGPRGIAVDGDGNLIVSDTFNHRIQIFSKEGVLVRTFGRWGGKEGELKFPHGVAVDGGGSIFVADNGNRRLQVFSSSGSFLRTMGREGAGAGELERPVGVAVDGRGRVLVTDWYKRRVSVFDGEGGYVASVGEEEVPLRLVKPVGVAVDGGGNVLVCDWAGGGNDRIVVFGPP
eukprot:471128-Hanusia_phi.AAC.1